MGGPRGPKTPARSSSHVPTAGDPRWIPAETDGAGGPQRCMQPSRGAFNCRHRGPGRIDDPTGCPSGRGTPPACVGAPRAPDPDTRHNSHSSRPRAVPAPYTRDKVPSAGGASSCDRKLEPSAARGRGAAAACPATGAAACSDPGSRRLRGPCQPFGRSSAHQVRHPGDKGPVTRTPGRPSVTPPRSVPGRTGRGRGGDAPRRMTPD